MKNERSRNERSRAYPFIDLKTACDLLRGPLAELGDHLADRQSLAKKLGYSTAAGGAAARKIAALVHYGFLDRRGGSYELSSWGRSLQSLSPDSPEYRRILRSAMEQPVLFRDLLDRYRHLGRLPVDLAPILREDEHGIKGNASIEAADIFLRSAIFSNVLARDGSFIDPAPHPSEKGNKPETIKLRDQEELKRIPLPLANWRFGYLEIPQDLDENDLKILPKIVGAVLETLREHAGLGGSAKVVGINSGSRRRRDGIPDS